MTKEQLYNALSDICPVFYGRAPINQALPYMVYSWGHGNNFAADGNVYQRIASVELSLYATDPETEEALNSKLDEMGIYWTSTTNFELSDDAYLTVYDMEEIEDES